MINQISKSPLLLTLMLLLFVVIFLSVVALVQSNNQAVDAPSPEISDFDEPPSYLFEWPPEEYIVEMAGCRDENIVIIHDQPFCRHVESDGAAGSIYTKYFYTPNYFEPEYGYSFVVRFPSSCEVYEGAAVEQCEQEKADFDPDELFYDYYQSLNE